MKKRLLASALTLCMALPTISCTALDTDGQNTAPQPVLTEASHVNPAGMRTLDRLGFVQLLAEASGEDISSYGEYMNPFTDTNDPSTTWAYNKWLINGNDAGIFRPHDAITRQEAAAILGRYLDYKYTELPPGCGTGAPSMDDIAEWARDDVMKCWMYGIIETGDKPEFHPSGLITGEYGKEIIGNAASLTASAYVKTENQTFVDSLVNAVRPEGNFMLSPYSARLCLAMLANGAKGDTQKELLTALQIDDLNAFNADVKKQFETYDGYGKIMSLDTANSIWLNQSWFDGKGFFLEGFEKTLKDNYRAVAEEVTNRDSVERVNAWTNEKTNGKISRIISEDNRDFVTALVNAVYFKAAWADEFYEQATEKAYFTNADGTKSQVDMMHQTNNFGYYSTPGVEALKMDYINYTTSAEDGGYEYEAFDNADFSMYLVKAGKDFDMQGFLDNSEFSRDTKISAYVPRFKLEYSTSLDEALNALGVNTAYNQKTADLSAMVDPSTLPGKVLFLDTVLQKTYVSIDEKGTEAAAVTAAMAAAGAALPTRPPMVREFRADSPFWFAIRDNVNGEILFVGRCESFD